MIKIFKENEATPISSKGYFTSLVSTIQYSDISASGHAVDAPMSNEDSDTALRPLADYLDRNLETLCRYLSTLMAQEVIKKIWDEILIQIEALMIPPLFGSIDPNRRIMNKRQLSLADWTLRIMLEFFHADGEGMGIPIKTLETKKYSDVKTLIKQYHSDGARIKREYELSLLSGMEKEYLLKLARLRSEKDKGDVALKSWVESQLITRKDRRQSK